MKRLLFGIVALVSVSSVVAIPSVALARKPLKEFAPAPTVTVEGVCDFPVLVDPIINQEYLKVFFDKDGDFVRQTVTGRFVVELTNLGSGEAMTVNVSGPVFFTLSGNTLTVRLTGRSVLFFFPGELTTGPAYIRVTNGPNILDVDLTTGAVTPRRESRNFVDVCEALAE